MTEDISACRRIQTWELESPVNLIQDTERESHTKTHSNKTLWHTKNQDAKSISKGSTEGAAMTQLTSNMPKKSKLENSKIISLKFKETITAKLEFHI